MAEAQDLGLDDGAAALLRAEIGARQEHHADGDAADLRGLAARIAHMLLEEILRDLDMDAGAVAGLAVGIDGAAMPHRLQRIDAGRHHVAAALAVQRHDQADAAGIDLLGGVVAVGGGELCDTGVVVADVLLGVEMVGHGAFLFRHAFGGVSDPHRGGAGPLLAHGRTLGGDGGHDGPQSEKSFPASAQFSFLMSVRMICTASGVQPSARQVPSVSSFASLRRCSACGPRTSGR